MGWTQTLVALKKVDPATRIKFSEYDSSFD
jgi:hypothetical protein